MATMSPRPPLRLAVRLTPRGGRDVVQAWTRGADGRPHLKVRVAAPPAEGAANAALTTLIARALKRPRSAVRIVGGAHARTKLLEIDGADEADVSRAFGEPG